MTEQALPLVAFYKGWTAYQKNLVKMIAPLSPEQLALPASSHHWSIGMVAQHIVANRVWWFQIWMGEGDPNLAAIAHWDPQDEKEQFTLGADKLVTGLKATWQMIQDSLTCWTAADLEHVFAPPTSMNIEEQQIFGNLTRQWIIWHVLEHEIHHGGELSLALGTYGLAGIYM